MSEPSASAWCVNTRQIRRLKRRGILRAMLSHERRPLGNQFREGRSVEKEDSSSRRRLTARPKHPDFRERASLRGAVKERRSWSNRKTRERFPAFFCTRFDDMGCSKLSKEGSPRASFSRRRGLPKAGSRTKPLRRPFTWRLRPVLLLGRNLGKLRHRSGRRARSCSTSPLSPFSVERLREKNGKKKAAQSLARGSADDAARWHGSLQTRTAGTPARGSSW